MFLLGATLLQYNIIAKSVPKVYFLPESAKLAQSCIISTTTWQTTAYQIIINEVGMIIAGPIIVHLFGSDSMMVLGDSVPLDIV